MTPCACNSLADRHGRELTKHGSTGFPAACYLDDLKKESVPWHWHDELEAFLVVKGSAVLAAGTKKYVLKAGDGCFINAGVLHSVWPEDPIACILHSLVFHPRLIGGSLDSIFWQDYVHPLITNPVLKSVCFRAETSAPEWNRTALQAVGDAWKSFVHAQPGYEFRIRSALSELLFLLTAHQPAAGKPPSDKILRDGERIKRMLSYIEEHYPEDLHSSAIAQAAAISESECLRCFRSTIGTTPMQYVKQFRIQAASGLLLSTEFKIADIATRCGFQDTSYFTKTFREMKGMTPQAYRKSRQTLC